MTTLYEKIIETYKEIPAGINLGKSTSSKK